MGLWWRVLQQHACRGTGVAVAGVVMTAVAVARVEVQGLRLQVSPCGGCCGHGCVEVWLLQPQTCQGATATGVNMGVLQRHAC